MNEYELLGALMPSHPNLSPIINFLRVKYSLAEISPDDDPIEEIYLEDQIISLEDFHQEIINLIQESSTFLPLKTIDYYKASKSISEIQEIKELELLPDDLKKSFEMFIEFMKVMFKPVIQLIDEYIESIANMLYVYLLTGETEELPNNLFGKVVTGTNMGVQYGTTKKTLT